MSDLADALEQYELAIAHGADSLTLSERFADLSGAHRGHVTDLYRKEQA